MDDKTTNAQDTTTPNVQDVSGDEGVQINVTNNGAKPVINDITPPPQPAENMVQVNSVDAAAVSETEAPQSEPEEVVVAEDGAPVAPPDTVSEQESLSPVVSPPKEIFPEPTTTESMPDPTVVGVAASAMQKHPTRNNKKFAAITTVVVALLLAGVAVYVYMSAKDNTESSKISSL